jgi:hypothetical protein
MNDTARRLAKLLFDQPLIQNQLRSAFVEAMIEPHLAHSGWRYCGGNWSGWDFQHELDTRLELKQSAAWQTWDPIKLKKAREADPELQPKPGPGIFDIRLRTGWFDEAGAVWTKLPEPGRPAHVYVFAWNEQYGDAADHRDPNQWQFFIIPTTDLPAREKTLRLSKLRYLKGIVGPFSGPERLASELAPYAKRLAPDNRAELPPPVAQQLTLGVFAT